MDTFNYWFLITLAAVFVGMGKGGLPVIATLGVPTLSLIMSPITAAGLLLPVYIVSDIFALSAYRRDFNWEILRIGMIGMTIGVIFGGLTAKFVIEWVVIFLIGIMGFLFSIEQLRKRKNKKTRSQTEINSIKGYFWCSISGFTSFISHTGGPPWQIFTIPLGLKKSVFVGTSVIAFSYCNVIKVLPYLLLGQINSISIYTSLIMAIPAILAVYLGVSLVKLIPEALFFKIVTWALFSISIKLMWDGIKIPLNL